MVELLGTYTEENASQAREDAHKSVIMIDCLSQSLHSTMLTALICSYIPVHSLLLLALLAVSREEWS